MSRHAINHVVMRRLPSGLLAVGAGAVVTVTDWDTGAAVPLYTTEAGGTVWNPVVTDQSGRLVQPNGSPAWVDVAPARRLRLHSVFADGSSWDDLYEPIDALDLGGRELGYAEITASATLTTTQADIAGLSVTVNVGSRPIEVRFSGHLQNATANGNAVVYLFEDGNIIGSVSFVNNPANLRIPAYRVLRRTPAPGSHTYKCQGQTNAGTATLNASAGNTTPGPASLAVIER